MSSQIRKKSFTDSQQKVYRLSAAAAHTPPAPRLRLLLVGGVSFPFSFLDSRNQHYCVIFGRAQSLGL